MYTRHRYSGIIALLALAVGVSVYLFARPDSFYALASYRLTPYSGWSGSLPSFFHTLGFGLLCAAAATNKRGAILLACVWGGIEFVAELTQHGSPAVQAGWLSDYRLNSTFDLLDLAAILCATGFVVMLIVTTPGVPEK